MKAVMLSIQPKWCELISSGKKTVEVRKTRPKLETPFKCYIYCTLQGSNEFFKDTLGGDISKWNKGKWGNKKGKVIGEFTCKYINTFRVLENNNIQDYHLKKLERSCLPYEKISEYIGSDKLGYSWHISDLVIYDEPKELSEFKQCHKCEYYANCYEHEYSCDGAYNLTRPPQSWCYVEELR